MEQGEVFGPQPADELQLEYFVPLDDHVTALNTAKVGIDRYNLSTKKEKQSRKKTALIGELPTHPSKPPTTNHPRHSSLFSKVATESVALPEAANAVLLAVY